MTNQNSKWNDILKNKIQPAFINPWKEDLNNSELKNIVEETINTMNGLKGDKENSKCFLGNAESYMENQKDIDNIKSSASMPKTTTSMKEVLGECSKYFNGMFNWSSPKAMVNVIPPAGIPSVAGSLMGTIFNPNLVEQNISGNVAALEIEVASIIAKLVGYDPVKAAGHFTFGGTGAYLFGAKLALTKVLGKDSRFTGIKEDAQILVSSVGHFAVKTCSDWTGVGMNNVRSIKLNEDSSMDLNHLEEVMEQCYKEGKPVAMIVATMGTTDAFAVDDIKAIEKIRDRFVEKHNLKTKPYIYADAVIGWAWSMFNDYDFENNPMEFSKETLEAIKTAKDKFKDINCADAIGIDFHKTGFTCYNCSMVCVKNCDDLELLAREKHDMAYLYQFSAYTPGAYTLECSRGGSYALSAWCNLKYFGIEGYRAILGGLVEVEKSMRKVIANEPSMVCVNENDNGFVTLFRVYPQNLVDSSNSNFAKEQYKNEFENPSYKEDLIKYNNYQLEVAKELQRMLYEENGPALSFTSNFRLNSYGQPVGAIKAYPMSPYVEYNAESIKENLIKYVIKASEVVDSKNLF